MKKKLTSSVPAVTVQCFFFFSVNFFQAIPQVTLVGHDWGGALVWSMAQFFPERVR